MEKIVISDKYGNISGMRERDLCFWKNYLPFHLEKLASFQHLTLDTASSKEQKRCLECDGTKKTRKYCDKAILVSQLREKLL
ncbi:hypothetical protein KKH23_00670 [Patescibacteria group bacterium]|nr:hypothetical protein [Patescibacteria group bacterium]MBU0845707.1 hypothetical protein [Patescibacteria group bacterium]MBU1066613.1 hypothetical protein [Patescibacteria group bacterium]